MATIHITIHYDTIQTEVVHLSFSLHISHYTSTATSNMNCSECSYLIAHNIHLVQQAIVVDELLKTTRQGDLHSAI